MTRKQKESKTQLIQVVMKRIPTGRQTCEVRVRGGIGGWSWNLLVALLSIYGTKPTDHHSCVCVCVCVILWRVLLVGRFCCTTGAGFLRMHIFALETFYVTLQQATPSGINLQQATPSGINLQQATPSGINLKWMMKCTVNLVIPSCSRWRTF